MRLNLIALTVAVALPVATLCADPPSGGRVPPRCPDSFSVRVEMDMIPKQGDKPPSPPAKLLAYYDFASKRVRHDTTSVDPMAPTSAQGGEAPVVKTTQIFLADRRYVRTESGGEIHAACHLAKTSDAEFEAMRSLWDRSANSYAGLSSDVGPRDGVEDAAGEKKYHLWDTDKLSEAERKALEEKVPGIRGVRDRLLCKDGTPLVPHRRVVDSDHARAISTFHDIVQGPQDDSLFAIPADIKCTVPPPPSADAQGAAAGAGSYGRDKEASLGGEYDDEDAEYDEDGGDDYEYDDEPGYDDDNYDDDDDGYIGDDDEEEEEDEDEEGEGKKKIPPNLRFDDGTSVAGDDADGRGRKGSTASKRRATAVKDEYADADADIEKLLHEDL